MQNNYNFSKKSLEMLKNVLDELNKRGQSSYVDFDRLSKDNSLQNMIMTNDFRQTFQKEFRDYLTMLNSIYSTQFKYLHRIKLEDACNRDCSFDLHFMEQYLLCLCCNNLSAYRNLPKLFVSLIDKFKI